MSGYKGKASPFAVHKRYFTFGASLDFLNYYGDLAPLPNKISTDYSLSKPGTTLFLLYRRGPRFSMQGSFMYGVIKGSDSESADQHDMNSGFFRYQRNLSFRNRIKELSFHVVLDLIENDQSHFHRMNFTPFVFCGLSLFYNNPQAQVPTTDLAGNLFTNAGKWIDLRALGTEGQYSQLSKTDMNYNTKPYSRLQLSIPLGLGFRYKINNHWDVSLEFIFRYLFTDYLDDVSKNYVDLGVFGTNELAKSFSYRSSEIAQPSFEYISVYDGKSYSVVPGYGSESRGNLRGNKHNNDTFTNTSIKIGYIIDRGLYRAKRR